MGLFDEMLEDQGEEAVPENTYGVTVGVVKENWDSEHPGMVKVEISLGASEKNLMDWAPVAVPYAGKEFGMYFLPEIGSQVLVAFHMGNINCPIVIGCLWNQTDVLPPNAAVEKNTVKTIKTKGGNSILISDEDGKEKITVETKGKLRFQLDDENKKISLQDEKADNAILIDTEKGELQFVSKTKAVFNINGEEMLTLDGNARQAVLQTKNITLEAGQTLALKGQTVNQEGNSMTLKGQNVTIESQTTLGLKATASLKAESSGIAEIKGAMVKIN